MAVGVGDVSEIRESVTARVFRVVDDEGNVRMLIGELPAPGRELSVPGDEQAPPPFGMELYDGGGRMRMTVLLAESGPMIAFDYAGNNILQFGVDDTDAPHMGAFLHVTDLDGAPVLGWQVMKNGVVESWHGSPTR